MTQYVEIAANVPHVHGTYHYHIPPDLSGQVAQGQLVIVPFGSQTVQGIVLAFVDQPEVPKTKPIQDILDPQPVVTDSQIALAKHIAEETLSPLGITLHAMLPSGLSVKADTLYQFTREVKPAWKQTSPSTKTSRRPNSVLSIYSVSGVPCGGASWTALYPTNAGGRPQAPWNAAM